MINDMEIRELKATKSIILKVKMQIFEKDGQYDVFMHPSIQGLNSVRITKAGDKDEIVAEALREFQEINGVRLRYEGSPISW
ncbi:hypothetical protein V7112_08465 [Bacillus sp. JJ1566]|uniref:hypothetical protein n=1 Tax=Bacillus sp. JJ1566 TaxID=3122961 RepID=UPI003000AD9B